MTSLIKRRRVEGVEEHLPRTISNSEASAFTQCQRKHYYGFLRKLEPNETGQALSRGIIGHEAMEAYYRGLMEGKPVQECRDAAINIVSAYLQQGYADTAMLADLINLLTRYFRYYDHTEWEILGVETAYEIPVNDDWYFGMRLDLLVRLADKTVVLVDHKFVYDFYSDTVLEMNAQMPKYLGTLRFNGIRAEYGILNQIRYRLKKGGNEDSELFKRARITPNNHEVRTYMGEQFEISERIMERRELSPEEQSRKAVRTANQMVCKNCSFEPLCKSEAMGGDIALMVSQDYKANAYVERQNPSETVLGEIE